MVLLIRALTKYMAGSHFSFMAKAEGQSKQSLRFSSTSHLAYKAILMDISEFHNHELCNSNTAQLHGKESQKFQLESHTWKTVTLLCYSSKKEKFCYQNKRNKASRFPRYWCLIIQVVEHIADKDKKIAGSVI